MDIKAEWLLDVAPHYYDLTNFPPGDTKRALERLATKQDRDRSDKFERGDWSGDDAGCITGSRGCVSAEYMHDEWQRTARGQLQQMYIHRK